ncbi:50S ribosomal protein L18 [bacterium 3DAC]|nr:50S ribosomal protein L18 [Dictyoglomota bacterium]UZN23314.1 50S ribosomal protein L18 [bacterium 3DAC]
MYTPVNRKEKRVKRHRRIRKSVFGTAERPRMAIYKSLKHMYVQIINDEIGHTLVSAATNEKAIQEAIKGMSKTEQAKYLGKVIAERALEKGIKKVVFDRGGFKYQGRVQALAEAAREAGLEF